ncbi:MAG: hypothetical protein COV99_09560 [Bacteroidetes bacterium CG12_big_fil_rev_8_21_14_0_65_60_17]|nr:MAG: hypothetical protein COV99_09560 [Bacteroidetes bacterium CG12_big_fil_rev_8_21_14_0_65_60_17]
MTRLLFMLSVLLLTQNAWAQEIQTYFDLEKRYILNSLRALDSTSWISVHFTNMCPDDPSAHPEAVTAEFSTIPCQEAARSEVVSLPGSATVRVGTHRAADVDGYSIDYVVSDSLRRVLLQVPPGTYELRGGHLRTYRIDVPPFTVQPGDSVVVEMQKTFIDLLGCESARIQLPPPDLRAEYLHRRQDFLYYQFRSSDRIMASCYYNVHDYLSQLPVSER